MYMHPYIHAQHLLTSTSLRVSFSSSRALSSSGETITPPLAPPKGTSITAVFQVLRDAKLQQLQERFRNSRVYRRSWHRIEEV
jgi:hypothetical protein